jgi:hypothetical protein
MKIFNNEGRRITNTKPIPRIPLPFKEVLASVQSEAAEENSQEEVHPDAASLIALLGCAERA